MRRHRSKLKTKVVAVDREDTVRSRVFIRVPPEWTDEQVYRYIERSEHTEEDWENELEDYQERTCDARYRYSVVGRDEKQEKDKSWDFDAAADVASGIYDDEEAKDAEVLDEFHRRYG